MSSITNEVRIENDDYDDDGTFISRTTYHLPPLSPTFTSSPMSLTNSPIDETDVGESLSMDLPEPQLNVATSRFI